ncbi:MAG: tyrosine-type recombinase/integrase [Bacteroidia bacterium]|nr:tyrosine-type recombinase/integrase [Bacteroidia bacterium]
MNSHSYITAFIDYQRKNRRMSEHTLTAYEQDLYRFEAFTAPRGPLEWDLHDARNWMGEMIEEGLAPRSVHRRISSLRSFYKYLRKQHIIEKDPLAKLVLPKMPKKVVQDIPASDLQSMFQTFPWHEFENGERDRLLMLLFYTTGMRLSELIQLKVAEIDIKRQSITVTGKRNKQRMLPLHPEIIEVLEYHIKGKPGNSYLFTTAHNKSLYPMLVYRVVTKYLRLFSDALKTSPHVLRHSFATHMLNNGAQLMAIKELLGHTSLSATQVYTKNSFEKLKAVHKLHPRN